MKTKRKALGQIAHDSVNPTVSWEWSRGEQREHYYNKIANAVAAEVRRRERKKTRIVWQSAEVANTWPEESVVLVKHKDGFISFDGCWDDFSVECFHPSHKFALISTQKPKAKR